MKKIIYIVGGIIVVVAAGRLIWAYQQVVADNQRLQSNSTAPIAIVSSETTTAVTPLVPTLSLIAPAVSSLSPTSGAPRTKVIVRGSDFIQSSIVLVGYTSVKPSMISSDGTELSFIVPSELPPADYYAIEIKNGDVRSDNQKMFSVTSAVKTQSTIATLTPKETLLAMAADLENVIKLGGTNPFKDAQSIAPVYKSSEFKQFIDKYLTKNVVSGFGTKTDPQKAWFILGLAMIITDPTSHIKERITGNTATVSYNNTFTATSKNGGPGDNICTLLTLDNNMWKMDPDKKGDCTNL